MSSMVSSSNDEDSVRNDGNKNEMNNGQLQLPWDSNYWSIKVSHVVSPIEVWATLTKNAVSKLNRLHDVKSI